MEYLKTKSGYDVKKACVSCHYKIATASGNTTKKEDMRYCKLHKAKVRTLFVCGHYRMRLDVAEL